MKKVSMMQRALHLFGLSGFAIAQPLFYVLMRQVEFLVARGGAAAEVLLLAVGLVVLPSLVMFGWVWALGFVSTTLSSALHIVFIWGLVFLTALAQLLHATPLTDFLAVLGAGLLSSVATLLYRRTAATRMFVSALSVAPLVFVVMFLTADDVSALLSRSSAESQVGSHERPVVTGTTPIFMLVFDEFPLSSLLDANGEIDARDFPSFASLASRSTWYPRAYTTGSDTTIALYALLTGRYPADVFGSPIYANYPENLFTLLSPYYDMNVVESQTLFYFDADSIGDLNAGTVRALITDLSIVYAHIALPKFMRRNVPGISRVWGNFAGAAGKHLHALPLEVQAQVAEQDALLHGVRSREAVTQLRRFQRQILETSAERSRGVLHFVHAVFPHSPWQYLPTGTSYSLTSEYVENPHRWPTDPWPALDAYRRHLLQVGYADKILGELIETLEQAGLYDDALIVVTADHGENFWPGEKTRDPELGFHPEDIVNVPLFVKRPQQRHAKRDVRSVAGVDVLPTIAEVIGATLPWDVDGCSLLRTDCPIRSTITSYRWLDLSKRLTRSYEFPADIADRDATRLRKRAMLPGGFGDPAFYGSGIYAHLSGHSVEEYTHAKDSAGVLVLDPLIRDRLLKLDETSIPARVVGIFVPRVDDDNTAQFAIATGGIIRSVVPALLGRDGRRVAAMLPEWALRGDSGELSVYRITGDPEQPELRPVTLE